ncbi:hypothetical protein GR247_34960 [Rhizobium leguminosarum]|nr:hypothetical protein [Rhizobium johnstonii]NEJ25285.1 hypothetical protein [Rhizobium leguminosarum]
MTDIDIDTLDETELLALNERIVERLHLLHRQKTDQGACRKFFRLTLC